MQMLSCIHILWKSCKSRDSGYSQLFAPFQKSPSVAGAGIKPACRLHLGDLGSPQHWGQGTEQHQGSHIPRAPAQTGFYPSIPPVPPGDRHPRAVGTGDTNSHGHSTPASLPPWSRSCTHHLTALSGPNPAKQRGSMDPEEGPRKGTGPAALSPLPGSCHTAMLSRTNGQELLPGERVARFPRVGCRLGRRGPQGHPRPDVELCNPASSSASTAFPAAVSLETGADAEVGGRKGHRFHLGKVGGWAVQQFLPARGDGWKAIVPLLPSWRCGRQDPPAQGPLRLWRGTSQPHISPLLHISICSGVGNTQCLDSRPRGAGTVTAGEAKDFVGSREGAGGGRGRRWVGQRRKDGSKRENWGTQEEVLRPCGRRMWPQGSLPVPSGAESQWY